MSGFQALSVESTNCSFIFMKLFKLISVFVLLFWQLSIHSLFADTPAEKSSITSLPQIMLNDLDGIQRRIDYWRGKVIILNFWATWCRPCQIEIPHLIKYQVNFENKGLQVIGIGLDEQRKLKNFVRTVGINYPVLHADPQQHSYLLQSWGDTIGVLPYTVVINKQGQLVYQQAGIFDDETFDTYVKPLLIDGRELTTTGDNSP